MKHPTKHQFGVRAVATSIGIASALILCETALRLKDIPAARYAGWKAVSHPPDELNELGYRGAPFDYGRTDFVILLVGDSQVESSYVDYSRMPESILEDELSSASVRARVFSIGAAGYGQDQQLLALREFFSRYRADLVIAWYTPMNDVWNNLFPTHWPAKGGAYKPTFRLEGDHLIEPKHSIGERISREVKLLELYDSVWLRHFADEAWSRNLPKAYSPAQTYVGSISRRLEFLAANQLSYVAGDDYNLEKCHLSICLYPCSPRIRHGISLTRRLLAEMQGVASNRGSQFLLFRHNGIDFDFVSESHPRVVYLYNGRYYEANLRQYLDNLRAIEDGFETFAADVGQGMWSNSEFDNHLNPEKLGLVIRQLAKKIASSVSNSVSAGLDYRLEQGRVKGHQEQTR